MEELKEITELLNDIQSTIQYIEFLSFLTSIMVGFIVGTQIKVHVL